MKVRQKRCEPQIGDRYWRRLANGKEVAEVLEIGDFGFLCRHIKFRATLFGQEMDETKVLSLAVFLENYMPRTKRAA